jgi:hypothetical protein
MMDVHHPLTAKTGANTRRVRHTRAYAVGGRGARLEGPREAGKIMSVPARTVRRPAS